MATAPFITAYELFKDQPSKKVGTILAPDQLYALATAMSYVELDFLYTTGQEVADCVHYYRKWCRKAPSEMLAPFAWYCQTCSELAMWTEGAGMADKSSWKANPNDYSRRVRVFLSIVLFSGMKINKEQGFAYLKILSVFNALIEHSLGELDKLKENKSRFLKLLLSPVRLVLRRFIPVCYAKFDKQTGILAREALERILTLSRQALEEDRVFTFELPEDQCEGGVSLDGMKVQNLKGGGMVTTQFLD